MEIKKINEYTPDEKVDYINDYYNSHKLSERYDISVNSESSNIHVDLNEK